MALLPRILQLTHLRLSASAGATFSTRPPRLPPLATAMLLPPPLRLRSLPLPLLLASRPGPLLLESSPAPPPTVLLQGTDLIPSRPETPTRLTLLLTVVTAMHRAATFVLPAPSTSRSTGT